MNNFNFDKSRPILVIDDCPMYRTATKGMLLKFGFNQQQIHLAHDAKTALQKCATQHFQMIMCDYNLGDAKNGHQLIDELQHKKLLQADCILLIVTGDASSEVVTGFAELSPDGYMVKPLSYATFSKRLPSIGRQKTTLSTLLISYANEQFSDSLVFAEEASTLGQSVAFNAQIIKAKSLMRLNQYNDARNLLIALRKTTKSAQINLLLAEIFIEQRHFQYSEQLLAPLMQEQAYKAPALHLLATQYFSQQQFSSAYESISDSVKASPKNTQRNKLKTLIALANLQLKEAETSIKATLHKVQNSFRNTIDLHQLAIMICLDQFQLSPQKEKKHYNDLFLLNCKTWRSQFPQSQYKPIELIAMARFYALRGMYPKAKLMLSEYQSWLSVNPEYQVSVVTLIELAKTQQQIGASAENIATQANIATQFKQTDSTEQRALQFYNAKWCNQLLENNALASSLKAQAQKLLADEYFERSVSLLLRAVNLNSHDLEAITLLHGNLTQAWPKGWSKQEVRSLALFCFEQLRHSPLSESASFIQHNQRLSKQLKLTKTAA